MRNAVYKINIFIISLLSLSLAVAQDNSTLKEIKELISKYEDRSQRPKSCPLSSSRIADVVAKMQVIKSTFKNNCLDKEDGKLDEVLKSFSDIEDELKKRKILEGDYNQALGNLTGLNSASTTNAQPAATQNLPQASSTSTPEVINKVNGLKMASHFQNINTMIKKRQCNLEDGRILQTTADLIYDATQFGLISGSKTGLMVAGGGFVASAVLKIIDLILKERFEFENTTDRQTFIKLNCSFYDVRSVLDSDGVLDIDNSSRKDDFKNVLEYVEQVEKTLKQNEKKRAEIDEFYLKMDEDAIGNQVGKTSLIRNTLYKLKDALLFNRFEGLPDETKKMLSINEIIKDFDIIMTQINYLKTLNISSIPMLDDVLIKELQVFNPINKELVNEVLKMPMKNFNETIKPSILFHVVRILSDIEAAESSVKENTKIAKREIATNLDKEQKEYAEVYEKLIRIKKRLEKIVQPKNYSASDDGTDNLVSVLEDYKTVAAMLYGDIGEKFLDYTSTKSSNEINSFKKRASRFSEDFYSEVDNLEKVGSKQVHYLCQDIQKLKLSFRYADSLVQEGYDFIVTNKDLFYGDVRNYYNEDINEENSSDSTLFLGPVEKIQRHYVSTLLALKKLRGKGIEKSDLDRYFKKSFFSSDQFLGKSMLDLEKIRWQAKVLQDKFDELKCHKKVYQDLE